MSRKGIPRRIRRYTIHTGGAKIPGLPFQGETMTCVICGRNQQSHHAVESQWRAITIEGVRHYACPNEFPPDDSGTKEEFTAAYLKVFEAIMGGNQ